MRKELWSDHWSTNVETLRAVADVFGTGFSDPCTSRNSYETLPKDLKNAINPIYDVDFLNENYRGTEFVFMNPPYSKSVGGAGAFTSKLVSDIESGPTMAGAVVLVNASTDTGWWQDLIGNSIRTCFARGRQKFDRILDSRVLDLSKGQRKDWNREMSDLVTFSGYHMNGRFGNDFIPDHKIEYVREHSSQPRYANCFHLVMYPHHPEAEEIIERFEAVFGSIGVVK